MLSGGRLRSTPGPVTESMILLLTEGQSMAPMRIGLKKLLLWSIFSNVVS